VKAVKLDACVEAILKGCNNPSAEKWFGAVQYDGNSHSQGYQQKEHAGGNPR
jgi:hypothetical protein